MQHRTRSVLLGLVATLATVAVLAVTLPAVRRHHTPADFTAALDLLALLGVTGGALWGWSIVMSVVVSVWRRTPSPATAPRWAPRWARRPLFALCGLALVAGAATPAGAAPPSAPAAAAGGDAGGAAVSAAAEAIAGRVRGARPASPRAPLPAYHVVRTGESLWRIAAALDPSADDADLLVRVADLHALNRDVIGPDSDLILPGQRLELP